MEVFRGDDTLQAFVLLFCLGVKCRRRVVSLAVDTQGTLWVYFLRLEQESIVNYCLANVALHMDGRFLLFARVDEIHNDF